MLDCAVKFLHLLKIGLITSEGKQCVKLVGLRLLNPDSGSFSPYAQNWKSSQVTDGSENNCCMHFRYHILDV